MPDADALARAHAFLARGDMGGTRTEESTVGTAVYHDAVPRRLDANYLRVEREADAETVEGEARRLSRLMILVPDAELGERLAPFFGQRGWRVRREVVMAQRRAPERDADTTLVREVREEDLRPARRRVNEGQPWGRPEVMAEIFAGKRSLEERVEARYFAAVVDGEVVGYADLYRLGADAQVEDVGTLPEHRGRGHATAVVLTAVAAARAEGAEFVFLVADRDDWPKELYRRLGFDELGYFLKFVSPLVLG